MVFNKVDLVDKTYEKDLKKKFTGQNIVRISVVKEQGMESLKKAILKKLGV
ncbi:hypothetical protein KKG31_03015 [Patescibacteria group bacterium]|nr:hypothetical protein [Patescibacteria group bacterium]MBU1758132.1 hypothetical protein [Patescibacteria group bacterium]